MKTNVRVRANRARRAAVADAKEQRADVMRFSLDDAEIMTAAAGRLPKRLHRACFAYAPLIIDANRAETERRLAAIPDYRRLWRLVYHMREALYADGLLTAIEYATLIKYGDDV